MITSAHISPRQVRTATPTRPRRNQLLLATAGRQTCARMLQSLGPSIFSKNDLSR